MDHIYVTAVQPAQGSDKLNAVLACACIVQQLA